MLCLGFFQAGQAAQYLVLLTHISRQAFGLSDPLQKLTVPFQHMIEK